MGNENDIGGKVGLDITDFKTNIAELNRQIKVIDSGFKAAAAGMDDWGKSEDGLQARIKSLNDITDLQRQKVANLTEQYQKVAAEKGENSKAAQDLQVRINKETESLNKNESELRKTTSALDNFGKEEDTASTKTANLDNKLDGIKSKFSTLGGNIAKAAAVGIAAIGTAAIGAAAGAFKLATDAGHLADDIITLSNQTGISTKQLQEWDYAMRFIDVPMETMTKSMAKLTKNMDTAGKGSKDITQAFDRLGVSFKDGVTGELRDSQTVFNELIGALGNVTNETERDALAMRLFGKSAQDLNPLIKAGTAELTRLSEEANNVGAVLSDDTLAAAGKFDDSMEKLKGSMKGVTASIGASFAPALSKVAESIQNALPGIADSIKQIDFAPLADTLARITTKGIETLVGALPKIVDGLMWIGDNAGTIAAGAIAIGAGMLTWNVVTMVQGVVKAVQAWRLATEGMTIAQGLLNIVMAANPVGLIITAVAALVAGIIVLWNTNDGFRDAIIGAWESVKVAGETVWNWLVKFFTEDIPNAFNGMIDWFKKLPGLISDFFTNIIDNIKQWGIDAVDWVKTEVPKIIQGILDFFNELPAKLGYALGYAIGTLIKWGIDAVKWAIEEVPKIIDGIIKFFTELPGKIATAFDNVMARIRTWGSNLLTWITTEVPKFIRNIGDFFAQLPGKIWDSLVSALGKIKDWLSDAISTVKTEVPKIISNIVDFFAELPGKMLDIGKDVVRGLWDGISGMVGWLKDKITGFAGGIVGGIKDALGINSPSRVMRDQVGKMIGAGMAEGIVSSARQVNAAMQQINGEVTASAAPAGRSNAPASGGVTNTYNFDGMLAGANFVVRKDSDIPAIAKEVVSIISNGVATVGRGMGVVRVGG